MDFKEYIVQRIEEMPLVTLAMEEKDGAVCIDFTKVDEKMYNGVLIGNTANAAKISDRGIYDGCDTGRRKRPTAVVHL